jgi:hypothetical protein
LEHFADATTGSSKKSCARRCRRAQLNKIAKKSGGDVNLAPALGRNGSNNGPALIRRNEGFAIVAPLAAFGMILIGDISLAPLRLGERAFTEGRGGDASDNRSGAFKQIAPREIGSEKGVLPHVNFPSWSKLGYSAFRSQKHTIRAILRRHDLHQPPYRS